MIVIEKNVGPKIDYEVMGQKICFDDDLTINLKKREEDWAVHIDICFDADGNLVVGTAAGRAYVAEIDIPDNVSSLSIGLDEERGQTAWYTVVL